MYLFGYLYIIPKIMVMAVFICVLFVFQSANSAWVIMINTYLLNKWR